MDVQRSTESSFADECEQIGKRFDVSGAVHTQDYIMKYICGLKVFKNTKDAIENYFAEGKQCARHLEGIVTRHFSTPAISLLEFGAGYGRVTRHLKKLMPAASIISCDIHP